MHLNADGSLRSTTDALQRSVAIETAPTLSAEEAIELSMAEEDVVGEYSLVQEPELLVHIIKGEPKLCWRIELRMKREDEYRLPIYHIDALTGEALFASTNLLTATGTGSGHYATGVSFETYYKSSESKYYLQDVQDTANAWHRICTTDMQNTDDTFVDLKDDNNVWGTSSNAIQQVAVDAHYYTNKALMYYYTVHSRPGIYGTAGARPHTAANGDACSRVGVRWDQANNAAWNSTTQSVQVGYPADNWNYLSMVDVLGHEWTHAVIRYSANLTYATESGALNESWADVFGEMIENYTTGSNDWLIAKNIEFDDDGDPATDDYYPLRDMKNPLSREQPDHYTGRVLSANTLLGDWGGVHTNSGIPNRVFSLLVDGGYHRLGGYTTATARDKAEKIWYRALVYYMTSGTTFVGARQATLSAAADLYGWPGVTYNRVNKAWELCGIESQPGDIVTIAGTGSAGSSGDNGDATDALLNLPYGVSVSEDGTLLIADSYNNKIRRVSVDGIITTIAGNGASGSSGDGGPATSALLSFPWSVVQAGADGPIYIADSSNHRIRRILNGTITTIAGTGTAGYSGDGGDGIDAKLNYPRQLVLNATGNDLWFADSYNHRIRRVNNIASTTNNPTISLVAGNGTAGFSGDGGAATSAKLNYPVGIARDDSGDLYVADTSNQRIRKITFGPFSTTISTVAGTGSTGNTGDGGAAASATFNSPYQLSWWSYSYSDGSSDAMLFVADYNNHVVRAIDFTATPSPTIARFAGTGTAGYSGDTLSALSAKLNSPAGVAVDANGDVFIADRLNHAIRKVYR